MSKVLIIGAGGVANVVVKKCAQLPEVFSHLIIALGLMPFGVLLYKHDTTPLLFGFLLSEPLIDNLKRVLVIYF